MADKVEVATEPAVVHESTFAERFSHYLEVTDPRTLLYSDEQIKNAKFVCDMYDDIQKPKGAEYHHYKKIVDATIHPVTGEIIPR